MEKRQLIDDIRKYNPTAKPRFLAQFDELALRSYLSQLESVMVPGKKPVRVRRPAKFTMASAS